VTQNTLAKLAVKRGDGLGSAVMTAGDVIGCGKLPNLAMAGILEVQSDDIARVEVNQRTSRSRSSEIARVLSVPPQSFPLRESPRSARGIARRAKNGSDGGATSGTILATGFPRSVTISAPWVVARRIHAPVFSWRSRMEIVFMCHIVTHSNKRVNAPAAT
jgi:hypothetical protein